MARRRLRDPSGLAAFDGIVMRFIKTRRVQERPMRNAAGEEGSSFAASRRRTIHAQAKRKTHYIAQNELTDSANHVKEYADKATSLPNQMVLACL
jgi:hypothetical protein